MQYREVWKKALRSSRLTWIVRPINQNEYINLYVDTVYVGKCNVLVYIHLTITITDTIHTQDCCEQRQKVSNNFAAYCLKS